MKKRTEIKAENRKELGKKVKKIRNEGWIPATVYGPGFESVSIKMNSLELTRTYEEEGESSLVDLNIGKEVWPILFKNPQYHPVTDEIIHIDCYKVDLTKEITATVPIELIGESPAVKEGNVLIEISNEVEVEALPTDLPEKFEIDISNLTKIDDMITMEELEYDKDKIKLEVPMDQAIVKIEEAPEEEIIEVETETVAPGDVPTIEQKDGDEQGEGGVEGEGKKETGEDKKEAKEETEVANK